MSIEAVPLPDEDRLGSEREVLVSMLDYYRAVLRRKAAGLDAIQMSTNLPPSELTIGGLLKHMALVENSWFCERLDDQPPGEPWASVDWEADRDWDFHSAAGDSPGIIVELYDAAIANSRAVLERHTDLDERVVAQDPGKSFNLRWMLVHMIEEYARHVGHADLIRESIDGATGD